MRPARSTLGAQRHLRQTRTMLLDRIPPLAALLIVSIAVASQAGTGTLLPSHPVSGLMAAIIIVSVAVVGGGLVALAATDAALRSLARRG